MLAKLSINVIMNTELHDSLELYVKQNYMQFHRKHYIQISGAAMVSSLSPLLVYIYVAHIHIYVRFS